MTKVVLSLVLVAIAVWSVRAIVRSRNAPAPVQPSPEGDDAEVIAHLVAAGSDPTKPHDVEFFLDFPDEASASRVCAELTGEGFRAEVKAPTQSGSEWLCFATKPVMPLTRRCLRSALGWRRSQPRGAATTTVGARRSRGNGVR